MSMIRCWRRGGRCHSLYHIRQLLDKGKDH